MEDKWLTWATRLQSIAQAGLEYSKDKYDIERFDEIRNISAEIISEYTDLSMSKVKDLFCNEKGYQTPKVDVRAAIFKDEKILLVKESLDGTWSLPGGWADIGLSVKENVIKESFEEAGVKVEPERIIAIQDRNKNNKPISPYSIYKIFVLCKLIEGEFKENIETEESGYFKLEELPKLSEGRNNKEQIELCFKAKNNSNQEAYFD
ncbi:NUDIX hydrolase N-terminal domain-containing protein [Clostridium massiliamazoniense]|uniref:NUDIX hydrolase N-terminal domain-containing protein n=1 Tax=Clostridium massiliamazoniense TaxID=1347366 RepID=UPI0006D84714|nr:NUDIX hydrolase [Clostridium massiliamazoniense]